MQNLSQLNSPNTLANIIASKNPQTPNTAEKPSETSNFHQTFMRQIQNSSAKQTKNQTPRTDTAKTDAGNNKLKNTDPKATNASNKNIAPNQSQNGKLNTPNAETEMSTDEVLDKLLALSNDEIHSKLLDFDKPEKSGKRLADTELTQDENAANTLNSSITINPQPTAEAMLASLQALNPRAASTSETELSKTSLSTSSTQNTAINGTAENPLTTTDAASNMLTSIANNIASEQKAEVPTSQSKPDFTAAIAAQLSKVNDVNEFVPTEIKTTQDSNIAVASAQTAAMQQNAAQQNIVNTPSVEAIKLPLGHERWNQAVNQKVVWMATNNQQSATLTLNPPDLGPVQVVINVHHDQTDTTFLSDNKEVRQALQDGMENLREAMKDAGITLGQTNINERQSAPEFQQSNQKNAQNNNYSSNTKVENAEKPVTRQTQIRTGNGLVDTFA